MKTSQVAKSRKCLKLPIISHLLCLEVRRRKLNEQWVEEDRVFLFFFFYHLTTPVESWGSGRSWERGGREWARSASSVGPEGFQKLHPQALLTSHCPVHLTWPPSARNAGKCRLFKLGTQLTPLKFGLFTRKKGEMYIILYCL